MLEDENGYLMAVIPASHHIEIGRSVGMPSWSGTENVLAELFSDFDLGAIPTYW